MVRSRWDSHHSGCLSKDLNMKVFLAVALTVGLASAIGSGPYLPSGWRPDGPSFYLPSEARPTVGAPIPDLILQGSEASGSDFLREYGPPKLQNLPEVSTEQAFLVLDGRLSSEEKSANVEAVVVEAAAEVTSELKSEVIEETLSTTEAEAVDVATEAVQEQPEQQSIQGKSLNLEVEESLVEELEGSTETSAEAAQLTVVSQEEDTEEVSSVSEVQSELTEEVKVVEEEVKAVEAVVQGVKNIAETIVNLEREVVEQQVQFTQDLTELKTVEQTSESVASFPEGFLEYGPPGFREYGPPIQNFPIPRSGDEVKSEAEKIDSNETRRRRFSPKFRSGKKH